MIVALCDSNIHNHADVGGLNFPGHLSHGSPKQAAPGSSAAAASNGPGEAGSSFGLDHPNENVGELMMNGI